MAASQWRLLGVILILVGATFLVISQMMISIWRKKKDKDDR